MNVLFITRKFPPMKGGMENVAFELYDHMSKLCNVKLISYGGSQKFLMIILPLFILRAAWNLLTRKIDTIYLQDGLLSPIGVILKIFGKPVNITIHGLDITYNNIFYQYLIPKCVKNLDKVICISNATQKECIKRGIPSEKTTVIANGISDKFYICEDRYVIKEKLEKLINLSLNDKKVLLSVGRLVERKGIHWFIDNVLPRIIEKEPNIIYMVVGDGKYRDKIKNIMLKRNLEKNIILLGKIEDDILKLVYNAADIFIMPNIPVKGDMEGFGVAALEAASCGLAVITSNLEGLSDAIIDGKNGILVGAYDTEMFVDLIDKLIKNDIERRNFGMSARNFSIEKYNWYNISEKYITCFEHT